LIENDFVFIKFTQVFSTKKNNLSLKEKERYYEEMLREIKKPEVLLQEFEKKAVYIYYKISLRKCRKFL